MRVVDASVALKWILPEEGNIEALALLEDHAGQSQPIIVPDILFYEVTNVLAVVTKLPQSRIEEVIDWFYNIDLRIAALGGDDFKKAAEISQECNISVYDASYAALAISLKASFVTADKVLVRKLESKQIKIEQI